MKRELVVFLLVGSLTVLIDFLSYMGLVWNSLLQVNGAKTVGFFTGTLFAYYANRYWTFAKTEHAAGSCWRFVILYASTLGVNVISNSIALTAMSASKLAMPVAFIFATGLSATLNFIGMKFFVFKLKHVEVSS
jgi:putative flippase GtrA